MRVFVLIVYKLYNVQSTADEEVMNRIYRKARRSKPIDIEPETRHVTHRSCDPPEVGVSGDNARAVTDPCAHNPMSNVSAYYIYINVVLFGGFLSFHVGNYIVSIYYSIF